MDHIEHLRFVLKTVDDFVATWGYNPYDNYVWREVLTVDYMTKYFPTFTKRPGRHGSDSYCDELGLDKVEIKSVKVKKRKRTNDYNLLSSIFFFDRQQREEFRERAVESDAYVFSVFDAQNSDYPISILFCYEKEKVDAVKELIREKQQALLAAPKKRDTIILKYSEVLPFATPYGVQQGTLFEFLI